MSDIAAPFRQLVERRLWPLALLLLAALAAVFLVLSEEEPAAPLPAPAGAAAPANAAVAATTPIVSLGDPAAREKRRKVLGARKDPFEPTVKGKKAAVSTVSTAKAPVAGGTGTGSSGSGGGVSVPTVPGVGVPVEPQKIYETYSLFVRFGEASDQRLTGLRNVRRLKALPSVLDPVVIYLGLLKDRRTAIFLVDEGVKVQGDGRCHPEPANCQTLHLKRGETAFFDRLGDGDQLAARYQLDLVRIKQRKTTDAAAARAARRAEAKGGRDALRARQSRVGNLRYDANSGVVREAE